ncbi:PhzF family phenazine biosynthesis protein [Paenochrobactrum sp. BZR 588]|uniref:PhzF family phenazine biosynthesis protein n=1 Tax=Paenochrobactrum TaxID=999488 RepID=UPI0035BC081A
MSSARFYEIYDVFTDKALAGNPLAIVHDAQGLTDAEMLSIAREFNLSETVFICEADNPQHRAAIRIFTPGFELPFAGHPTVGTAISLVERLQNQAQVDQIIVLEEKIGLVRCVVNRQEKVSFAEFDLPQLPKQLEIKIEREEAAAAIGLGAHEVGFENHVPGVWSAGAPYLMIPVANMIAAAKVSIDPVFVRENLANVNGRSLPVYIYCRDTRLFDSDYHARMFVTEGNVYEDPATGSAVAAFSGVVHKFDQPLDGIAQLWIEQGIEMGRQSRIRLELEVKQQILINARIGGSAVKVADGHLYL